VRGFLFDNFLEFGWVGSGECSDEEKEEQESENPEKGDWFWSSEVFDDEWIGRDVSDFLTEKEIPENENHRYQEEDERRGKGHEKV
jgi:hypothetical protein